MVPPLLLLFAAITAALPLIKLKFSYSHLNGKSEKVLTLGGIRLPTDRKRSGTARDKKNTFRLIKALFGIKDELLKRITIEIIKISYVSADRDPYNAVMKYNIVNAVTGSALFFAENSLKIKDSSVYICCDHAAERSSIEIEFEISIRACAFVAVCLRSDKSLLKLLIGSPNRGKEE